MMADIKPSILIWDLDTGNEEMVLLIRPNKPEVNLTTQDICNWE